MRIRSVGARIYLRMRVNLQNVESQPTIFAICSTITHVDDNHVPFPFWQREVRGGEEVSS